MSIAVDAVREFPRRFVAEGADLGAFVGIEPYFDMLQRRPIPSRSALEEWIADWSELEAAIDQERTARYVAMTCQTDDPAREAAYTDYIENVIPKCRPRRFALQMRLAECPLAVELPKARYEVLLRAVRNETALYRERNIPLLVEDDKLKLEYQKIVAAQTVNYRGQERTLQQMGLFLLEPDRATRQEAWELTAARRLADADAIDALYDKMVAVRHRIACNADLPDYRAYAYRMRERFDYGPADAARFRKAIRRVAVPAARRLSERRRRELGVDRLRPWDLAVDPKGRPPLRPFREPSRLVDGCRTMFDRLDPEFSSQFRTMADRGWLDLASRKGKAPGGYQETYQEQRRPFIFMNAVGTHRDLVTMVHEAGHAFHAFACRGDPLVWYRTYPTEFAEVASMGMELLTAPHWGAFYDDADLRRARTEHLEGIVQFLPYMAIVDEFQDEVYTRPQMTPAQRRAVWLKLLDRYGGIEDWSGRERARECSWHRQPHPFELPFYYIEYGIAQLGALQLWVKARRNAAAALADYKRGLALGGSRPLPELFGAAGLNFDFSPRTLGPLVEQVLKEVGDGADRPRARAPQAKTGSRKSARRSVAKPGRRARGRGRSRRGRKYR